MMFNIYLHNKLKKKNSRFPNAPPPLPTPVKQQYPEGNRLNLIGVIHRFRLNTKYKDRKGHYICNNKQFF